MSSDKPTTNASGKPFEVTLTMPQTVSVRMVVADVLQDYEIWFFLSSLLFSSFVGFVVAAIQTVGDGSGGPDYSTITFSAILGVLFIISVYVALSKRRELLSTSENMSVSTFPLGEKQAQLQQGLEPEEPPQGQVSQ